MLWNSYWIHQSLFLLLSTHQKAQAQLSFQLESELDLDINNNETLLETILFGKHISPTIYSKLLDIVNQYLSDTVKFA